jgi:hypothetical protein
MMGGSVGSAAGLVWRHRRLLWWIAAVNLALAWLGSLAVRATLSAVLDHSLESAKLVTGFDVSTLVLLLERPEVQMRSLAPGALEAAAIFLLFMLTIDGGLLTVYLQDRKLSREEFFGNCGRFFWRMARLALYSLAPFGLLMAAGAAVGGYAGRLANDAPQERLGWAVNVASKLAIVLLALLLRLWFDLAQARVVQGDEPRILRELLRSFKPAFRSGLYAKYLGIVALAAASMAVGIWVWLRLPHGAMMASFVVLELVTIAQIASRLWLKAASARWVARTYGVAAIQMEPVEAALTAIIAGTDLDAPRME